MKSVTNYRPITLLSAIPKVFESIVFDMIYQQVEHLIIDEQHGFMRRRSVLTNLTLFTNFVASHIGKGLQVDVIYTDFAKAFDKVDHAILVSKLEALGFSVDLIICIKSYLNDRYSSVRVEHEFSDVF
ncbi:uncharacterized protein LOC127286432 [Leptopilina boulardi]|uniref:uncharacterized protein LOC127286432 n=1 Tax=Leptopilina boulardi TaxID=63433 RepID=UPI0021F50539|nr:uncharacterized protein LOC127286432 [Leptopilina boulardi]